MWDYDRSFYSENYTINNNAGLENHSQSTSRDDGFVTKQCESVVFDDLLSRFGQLLNVEDEYYTRDYLKKNIYQWTVCETSSWLLDRAEYHGVDNDVLPLHNMNGVNGRLLADFTWKTLRDKLNIVTTLSDVDSANYNRFLDLLFMELNDLKDKSQCKIQDVEKAAEVSATSSLPPRKVGRPKKEKAEVVAKAPDEKLPQFLWRLLNDRQFNPSIIKWQNPENTSDRIFKFQCGEKVAELWGDRKKAIVGPAQTQKEKKAMTYEKMTRAMRYYYDKNILAEHETRLTYQFGPNFIPPRDTGG